MRKPESNTDKKREALGVFAGDYRTWVFKQATEAACYFNLTHGTILRYESLKIVPPLGYLACLVRLYDERHEQAGRLNHTRREKLLQQMRKLILMHYPAEQPFLDWDELLLAADGFMKAQWGENWLVKADNALQKVPLGNLPPRHEAYLGYEQEVKNILDWLASHYRMVFIEGLDGVGKTWLAIEVGNHCLSDSNRMFVAGIWISAKDHPEQKLWLEEVLNTVARQLRYPHLVHLPLVERRIRLNELLRRYPTLLIIDNFNTIDDLDLEDWIRQVPGKSKVLITSRYTNTTIASEYSRSLRLGGLTTPSALQFIRIHVQSIQQLNILASAPDHVLIPLVEAAAGNPQLMKLALGELPFRDFSKAVEYVMQKEKMWERKWEILAEDTRQMLIITSFFTDSMSGEALGTAAGLEDDHLYEALKQLEKIQLLDVHKVLFQKDLQIRYSIHPTVRAFATNKLKRESAFEEQARKRWVTYFLNFAKHYLVRAGLQERYWHSLGGAGLAPIDQEWSNFKEVLRWLDEHGQDQTLVDLLIMLVHYMHSHALFPERMEFAEKAAKAAQRLGQKVEEAYLRIDGLGWILIKEHRFKEAFEQIDTGLTIAQNLGMPNEAHNLMTLAHAFRAMAYLEQGDTEKASKELAKVQSADCSLIIRSRVDTAAGDIAIKEKNYPRAIQSYRDGLAALQQTGVDYESSSLHYRLGFAYLAVGDVVQAEAAFNQRLSGHQSDITIGVVCAEYGLAQVAQQKGEIRAAYTLAQQAYHQLSALDADHELLTEIEGFLDDLSSRLP